MKKLILGLVAITMTISSANAWSIEKKEYTDSGIKYFVNCNGIKIITATKDGNSYWDSNGIHRNSLNSAIESSCKKYLNSEKIGTIKKGTILFKKRFGKKSIEYCLKRELNWASCELDVELGYLPKVTNNSKIKILQSFSNKNLIEDYYKITDNNNIYYVRKQDVQ